MNKKIKLIWDFRGNDASNTARHHAQHLEEYIAVHGLPLNLTGFTDFSDLHSSAFIVVEEKDMIGVRDALLPHRGELYEIQD